MQALESAFEAACSDGKIPGAVLVATDKSGDFHYAKAFGLRSLKEGQEAPLGLDSILALFSSTKLITTIAVLQLVERGQVNLDDDVGNILPEIAQQEILIAMKDGKGVFVKRQGHLTLRHLLSHSSGLAYTFMSPNLMQYHASLGPPQPPRNVAESYNLPLIFEPGTSWKYSTGCDWAGLLVARVSKMDLETYCQENVSAPLGITDMTYWPKKNPELAACLASLSIRDPSDTTGNGKAQAFTGPNMHAAAEEEMGGQGLYASMPSYLKVLRSLLVDDEKLLLRKTTAMMFEPQLTEESRAALQEMYVAKPTKGPCAIGHFPPHVKYDWGLGGLLTMQDVDEDGVNYRKNRCLNWSGMPNLFWFIDRAAGICGMYGGQMMPSGDAQVQEMINLFEKTMYEQAASKGKL